MPSKPPFRKRKYKLKIYFREHREHAGLTQQQLADRIGTSKTRISMKERGAEGWDASYLGALAEALGVTDPASLLMRNPLDKNAPYSLLDSLKPENRAKAVDYIETLAKVERREDQAA